MWYHGLDIGIEKRHQWKNWWIWIKSLVYLNFSRNSKVGLFSGLINFVVWQQDQETKFVLSLCSATLSMAAFPLRLTLFIATVWLPASQASHKTVMMQTERVHFLYFFPINYKAFLKVPKQGKGELKILGRSCI